MQAVILRADSGLIGEKCRACPLTARAGQTVLVAHWPEAPYGRAQRFVVHVACVRVMIQDLPDEVAVAVEELRERILTSGDPWA